MKKFFKRSGCVLLGLWTFCTVACTTDDKQSSVALPTGYELWSAPATEKILQDVDDSEYSAMKETPFFEVDTKSPHTLFK